MEEFTSQLESLIERNKGFPQQLKQRLIQESTNVKNPFNFIGVLINEGVLNDEPNQQDQNFGWTVGFIVQLIMTMACSKGADAIVALINALEESGNEELASALRTWVKLAIKAEGHSTSARKLETSVAHTGTELIDNVMSRVKDELMVQLVFKACNIAHSTDVVSNLTHQGNVLHEPNLELASESINIPEVSPNLAHINVQNDPNMEPVSGPSVRRRRQAENATKEHRTTRHERRNIDKVKKAGCSKKAIGLYLVLPFILAGFFAHFLGIIDPEQSQVIDPTQSQIIDPKQPQVTDPAQPQVQSDPKQPQVFDSEQRKVIIDPKQSQITDPEKLRAKEKVDVNNVENLSSQTATGIFVATTGSLVALDLRTSKATALTNESTLAVAVNHKLQKVYWTEGYKSSAIMRSNFNGSGEWILLLAIDEQTGNLYFALLNSHEIKVCNARGKNCTAVISDSSLVKQSVRIALDSKNGFMYWGHRPPSPSPHSIVRAKLDGSNATMISTGFHDISGITLDQPSSGLLYWTDDGASTIGSINVNGGNQRAIVRLEVKPLSGLHTIQVDANEIYFCIFKSKSIQIVEKDSGKLRTVFSENRFQLSTRILEFFDFLTSPSHVHDFELFSDPVKKIELEV